MRGALTLRYIQGPVLQSIHPGSAYEETHYRHFPLSRGLVVRVRAGADSARAEEGADRGAEEAAGPHARVQRAGRREEARGRAAQAVHELLPEGRSPRGQDRSAGEDDDLQQAGEREEAQGRRAQEVHERVPQGLTSRTLRADIG